MMYLMFILILKENFTNTQNIQIKMLEEIWHIFIVYHPMLNMLLQYTYYVIWLIMTDSAHGWNQSLIP